MQFDDRLATVLRSTAQSEPGARTQYRQLLDLLGSMELLWGRRTDNDGAQGDDIRLQTSFKFSFSSKDIWGD